MKLTAHTDARKFTLMDVIDEKSGEKSDAMALKDGDAAAHKIGGSLGITGAV